MHGKIEPYLNFPGNAREAFNFYAQVFDLDPPYFMAYSDMPPEDQEEMKDMVDKDYLIHGSINLNGTLIMGSDASDMMFEEGKFIVGNNIYLSWSSEEAGEVKKVWDQFIAAGSKVIMPLGETFWAPLYGILKDPYGIQWMIQNWVQDESI